MLLASSVAGCVVQWDQEMGSIEVGSARHQAVGNASKCSYFKVFNDVQSYHDSAYNDSVSMALETKLDAINLLPQPMLFVFS